jgi:hypothetical protein
VLDGEFTLAILIESNIIRNKLLISCVINMRTLKSLKKLKVSYMGKHLKDIYPHATTFQVLRYRFNKFMEKAVAIAIIVGMIYGGFKVGQMTTEASVSHANVEIIKEVPVEIATKAPIMEKIAHCESGGKHYGKSGQVIFNANTNGSVDVGKYQINTVWFAKATEMGLDVTKEEDNEAMARWIYENRGTEDWYSSKSCWQK